jgi:adenosylcobinamide-phosphate guanylyltransferase
VTSGDLPLLDAQIIKKIVTYYNSQKTWTSILVTKNFLNCLKIESNYSVTVVNQLCCFTGISLINSKKISSLANLDENYIVIDDKRIALNLNTKHDYDLLSTT